MNSLNQHDDRSIPPGGVLQPDRLDALAALQILDTPSEESFDRLTRLACRLLGAPVGLVSLVDRDRQFFKSQLGLPEPFASARQTPLSHSFCQHVVNAGDTLVISDAREHPLVCDNLAIRDLNVVAYLGVPLTTEDGHVLGSFCVIDGNPREWSADDIATVTDLAASVITEIEAKALARRAYMDLIEFQRSQSALAASEAQYAAIVSSSLDSIVSMDIRGRVTAWNPAAESMFGYPSVDVLGRELADVIVPPHFRDAHREGLRRYVQTGDSQVIGQRIEIVAMRADGSEFPVELAIAAIGCPGPQTFTGHIRDITDRKRADELLREREERFRSLVHSASDIITILSADGTILYESPSIQRVLGHSPETILGCSALDFVHIDDIPHVAAALGRLVTDGGVSDPLEFRFRHADGTWRYLEAIGTNLIGGTGVDGIVVNSRDVTDRKSLEVLLEAHNVRLEQDVVHRTAELEAARIEILERLAVAAEYRDDITGEHTRRVGRLAAALARQLGLPPAQVALIRRAAQLHDVGKIGIPDQILLKRGKLSVQEYRRMQEHTSIGARILTGSEVPLLQLAESIAIAHHERWDGAGYPCALSRDAIPIAARIVSVADVFDALIQERPYKPAWDIESAIQEIARNSGTQFDPDVVQALLRLRDRLGVISGRG